MKYTLFFKIKQKCIIKLLSFILIIGMLFALVACKEKQDTESTEEKKLPDSKTSDETQQEPGLKEKQEAEAFDAVNQQVQELEAERAAQAAAAKAAEEEAARLAKEKEALEEQLILQWEQVDGGLKHVSVGSDGTVWGVNTNDNIFHYNGSGWGQIPGGLKQISVGNANNVWGVNSSDSIFKTK